ncbi:RING-H2 finger protein ATL79-like [Zingiber officinale]|nr:RING-H2 finger protein ATL79-like [Zingiber officinale]
MHASSCVGMDHGREGESRCMPGSIASSLKTVDTLPYLCQLISMTFPPPPPLPLPLSPVSANKWAPFSGARDFDASMAAVLLVVVCAAALAFALHAALRLLLRRLRARAPPRRELDKPLPESAVEIPRLPGSVVFSGGATSECAICLAEMAEGERVRVVPDCGHVFHAMCVDAWLLGRSTCPTCRTDWRPPPAAEEP